MIVKLIVIFLLLVIVMSLASALVYLVTDKGETTRTVKALTIRISLSLLAFFILMASHYMGWIQPHGIYQ